MIAIRIKTIGHHSTRWVYVVRDARTNITQSVLVLGREIEGREGGEREIERGREGDR